jgi:hypothetical protein
MKKHTIVTSLRAASTLLVASCQNPYLVQMEAVQGAYVRREISRSEYNTRMAGLQTQSNAWANQNAANAAVAMGTLQALDTISSASNANQLSRAISNQNSRGGGGQRQGPPQ